MDEYGEALYDGGRDDEANAAGLAGTAGGSLKVDEAASAALVAEDIGADVVDAAVIPARSQGFGGETIPRQVER